MGLKARGLLSSENECLPAGRVLLVVIVVMSLFLAGLKPLSRHFLMLRSLVKTRESARQKARLRVLNHLMPESPGYLLSWERKEAEFDRPSFEAFAQYYAQVRMFFPQRGDARVLEAYTRFFMGSEDQARKLWQEALALNGGSSSAAYNLTVLASRAEEWETAQRFGEKALSSDWRREVARLAQSHLYRQLFSMEDKPFVQVLVRHIGETRQRLYLLLMALALIHDQVDRAQALVSQAQSEGLWAEDELSRLLVAFVDAHQGRLQVAGEKIAGLSLVSEAFKNHARQSWARSPSGVSLTTVLQPWEKNFLSAILKQFPLRL